MDRDEQRSSCAAVMSAHLLRPARFEAEVGAVAETRPSSPKDGSGSRQRGVRPRCRHVATLASPFGRLARSGSRRPKLRGHGSARRPQLPRSPGCSRGDAAGSRLRTVALRTHGWEQRHGRRPRRGRPRGHHECSARCPTDRFPSIARKFVGDGLRIRRWTGASSGRRQLGGRFRRQGRPAPAEVNGRTTLSPSGA